MSESVLPMFSSRSFIVSGLTFRSLIHFEFISVYGVRKCSIESVLMRWMKLEIIRSEVSQKDKHQYSILMHIYGIKKDGNDNPICKTEKETQMYRTDF